MPDLADAAERLLKIPRLAVHRDVPLATHTRFGIGGPASLFCETPDPETFTKALYFAQKSRLPRVVIGGGTNLIVSDEGFDGIVLRYTAAQIKVEENLIRVDAGAVLQNLIDISIEHGLDGMHTMTGIPGSVGAALYGNAGAYGHSIEERVEEVLFTDGSQTRSFDRQECQFRYRESIFKQHKEWVILSAKLRFIQGDPAALRKTADEILAIRNAKYPPAMKCAGSIFKNCLFAELPKAVQQDLPPKLVREGKVPSAYFLEQVGAKGIRRGDIHVADYHANLIYNAGQGSAEDLVAIIQDLKWRVEERFGFSLEEEVQYVGFDRAVAPA